MIVGAYLKVTSKQWEEIKEKYVISDQYHIINNSKRKCNCCIDCGAYNPCTAYEGYCSDVEELVSKTDTCEDWHDM